ncbi:MAG TPA: hypothetical protein VK402_21480 [Blastococcus sp.]|nr:hypothetical protein [Blastococcus sp.]
MTQLDSPATAPGVTADERLELERLRREVRTLRTTAPAPKPRFRWRSLVAVLLIVVGCVLAPVAGLAVWTNNQVSNTDRFVRSISPLIEDPDVQARLTDRITDEIFTYVDVQGLADDGVAALVDQGLPAQLGDRLEALTPTLTAAVTSFVHDKVAELVASDAFVSAWNTALRAAHAQIDAVLSGESQTVVVRGDSVYLDMAPFIDLAKQKLSDAGLTAVDLVPEVHPTVRLARADTLVRAQTAYTTLDTVAGVLPWTVLLLFGAGLYLARNRFRALVGIGLGLVLSMLVLGAGLLVARGLLVGAVPAAAAPATASGFDIVVTYLRLGLRALMVLGLVLALAGFLAGTSDTAVSIRRWTAGHLHSLRGNRAGGPVSRWVRPKVRGLRIGAVALAVLVFALQDQPTGGTILIIASVLLLALAAIEILGGRPEKPSEAQVETSTTEREPPRQAEPAPQAVGTPGTGSAPETAPPPRPPT